jgi:membrane carboxypeptidase/penicillin-binding protein
MEDSLRESAIRYHMDPTPGKLAIQPTKPLANKRDLALAYSPGVAYACELIEKDPNAAAAVTSRGNLVAVVTNGTAREIDSAGQVYGKTGEAEFEGGSHAWFAGYRGDLAFAALIVGGGSSTYAVRMVKQMLQELPDGYLA